jgi:hypothetical protein
MSKRGLHLYKRLALTTLTALIGLGGAAQAQNAHAGGPVYGGPTTVGKTISCGVLNFGTGSVVISSRAIYAASPSGAAPIAVTPLTTNPGNCTTLAPLQTCAYTAVMTTGDLTYSCVVSDQSTVPTSLSVLPTIN